MFASALKSARAPERDAPIRGRVGMRKVQRLMLVAAVAALVVGMTPFAASAASLTVTDTTPAAGQVVILRGNGCIPNGDLTFKFDSTTLRVSFAGSAGTYSQGVRIPVFATAGTHRLRAACEQPYPPGSTLVQSITITVHRALSINDSTPARGQMVVLTASRVCVPSSQVRYLIDRTLLRKTTAGTTGSFSAGVRIPAGTSVARHSLFATCAQKDLPGSRLLLGIRVSVH